MLNHIGTKTLQTERLTLRAFKRQDAEDMFNNWANDDKVTEYLSWPTHQKVEITQSIVNQWAKESENKESYHWAIVVKENNAVIGSITVVGKSDLHEWAELGYCISQEYWGKGITLEAVNCLIKFLMDEVGYNRIQAIHYKINTASGRVMQKAGMKYEGLKRQYIKDKHGKFVDVESYAIVKSDLGGD